MTKKETDRIFDILFSHEFFKTPYMHLAPCDWLIWNKEGYYPIRIILIGEAKRRNIRSSDFVWYFCEEVRKLKGFLHERRYEINDKDYFHNWFKKLLKIE